FFLSEGGWFFFSVGGVRPGGFAPRRPPWRPRAGGGPRPARPPPPAAAARRMGGASPPPPPPSPPATPLRPASLRPWAAHGVAPSVRESCEARGLRVVDAVCPLVSKVHAEARRYADTGHLVALVGHADHVEVIGTKGERPDAIVVVESPEDAERLDIDGKPLAVISQTTLSLDDVASTVQ